MRVATPDASTQNFAIAPARAQAAAASPLATPAAPLLPAAGTGSESVLNSLLAAIAEPAQSPLPAGGIARLYAESGAPPAPRPAAPTVLTPADTRLLSDVSASAAGRSEAAARQAALAQSATEIEPPSPPAVAPAPPVITINGQTIAVTSALAAAIRIALGAAPRRIGPSSGFSDVDGPMAIATADAGTELEAESRERIGGVTATAQEDKPLAPRSWLSDPYETQRDPRSAEYVAHQTGPPPGDSLPPAQSAIAPVAVPIPYAEQPASHHAVSAIAIAFAAGVSPADVTAKRHGSTWHIIVNGSGEAITLETAGTPAPQLLFRDGTTLSLDAS